MGKDRPRLIVNFAITADGKVSTRNHTPSGFTSATDKRRFREIRSLGDAVLAGARTVAADTMSLGLSDPTLRQARRKRGQSAEPLRVIVSNKGNDLDPKAKVFQYRSSPLVVFSTTQMSEGQRSRLSRCCDLWILDGRSVDLPSMLHILRKDYRIRTLVCEGGPTLFRALLELGAVDEIRLTWAPVLFEGKTAPSLTGLPGKFLPKLVRCELKKMEVIGDECYLTYKVTSSPAGLAARKSPRPAQR